VRRLVYEQTICGIDFFRVIVLLLTNVRRCLRLSRPPLNGTLSPGRHAKTVPERDTQGAP